MNKKNARMGDMETRMKRWGAKLDKLVAHAESADADVATDYHKSVSDLKLKHKVAQSKMDELKAAGSEEWETIKTGVEIAWNDLEHAFESLSKDTRSLMVPAHAVAPRTAGSRSASRANRRNQPGRKRIA